MVDLVVVRRATADDALRRLVAEDERARRSTRKIGMAR